MLVPIRKLNKALLSLFLCFSVSLSPTRDPLFEIKLCLVPSKLFTGVSVFIDDHVTRCTICPPLFLLNA